MPATVRYNTLRLLTVIVVGAVLYVFGVRGLPLLVLAFVISLPLSYVLLARWRRAMIDEFASGKASRLNPVTAVNRRIEGAKQAEDAVLDAGLGSAAGETSGPASADPAEDTDDGDVEPPEKV